MTVTTLDRNTASIIIDLQRGIVAYRTVHPIGETGTTQEIIDLLDRTHSLGGR